VSARDGSILGRYTDIHTALNRAVYSANNGTSLPGTLKRSEGQAATGDAHVDGNYDKLGGTYNCYKTNFNRDSYNNAGAQLKSTVHYSSNYVNAYWNGTQMVYGDGNGVDSGMLGLSADVTTHELTHAVTENESNLTYSGESGGLNEAMSDIFGAYCESWASGTWATTNAVFMVGDDIWTPATAGDALRYMYDPAKDGVSLDYWTSTAGSKDVHYSSGIANLAFTLLSKGGTHPRGKSTVNVTGIGVQKAVIRSVLAL
jgi:vibriolysin